MRRTNTDLHTVHTNFSVVLLCLQLQLDVQEGYLRVLITFGLHLKASIGEGLLKGHTSHQLRVLRRKKKVMLFFLQYITFLILKQLKLYMEEGLHTQTTT